jgi:hypothetical protein
MPLTFRTRNRPSLQDFHALFEEVRSLNLAKPFPVRLLRDLATAWGNPGFSAGKAYLARIAERAAATQGPILECGSGLSTLLMGMLTAGRGVEIIALEHTPLWRARVQEVLDTLGLDHVRVQDCPVVDHGLYDWYQLPESLPDQIRLVVCDGPPGRDTRGGRVGLIPQVGHLFHPECVILLDDTHRKGEKQVLETWNRRQTFRIEHHGLLFRFAEMTAC